MSFRIVYNVVSINYGEQYCPCCVGMCGEEGIAISAFTITECLFGTDVTLPCTDIILTLM